MATQNLAEFYRKNSDAATSSYRAFTNRVKSGKFKDLMEALTFKKDDNKKVKVKTTKVKTPTPEVKEKKDSFVVNNKEVKKPRGS